MELNVTEPSRSAPLDTNVDHRSLLHVTSWVLIITTFLVVSTRCASRWAILRRLALDDYCIILSTLFAIGTTASLSVGVSNGLGMLAWELGTRSQTEKIQKAVYSANILFVLSQGFAKLSMAIFIRTITPNELHRSFAIYICFAVTVWMINAVFGLVFQCHMPAVWNSLENVCTNRLAFYTFAEVASIAIDFCLIVLPVTIASQLKMNMRSKLVVIGCFASRGLVIAAIIVQLVIMYHQNETGGMSISWSSVMSTIVALNIGIISACVPYLKPFLQSLNSGMIGNDDIRRRGGDTAVQQYASKPKSYSMKKMANILSSRTGNSAVTEESFPATFKGLPLENSPNGNVNANKVFVTANGDELANDWERGSDSSKVNIIRQTSTFAVKTETVTP
ncbi:hypothetical protein HYALB_00013367 [Hymenoscyphus albidus]|uniref:Rhodopsin domain-containing protein n=1 Tax=Hymenoscyphus albidus TaxID=595503 RepID=A0A9N9LSM4_9HELO|nr:hypothetical protein HYALB_00013367 [Hymenoscyphus albidus]